jgi:hypothetical protein
MFLGVLPFAAGAIIAAFGLNLPPVLSPWPDWYRAYTLVIGSFMAGTLWQSPSPVAANMGYAFLVISNLAALSLWVAAGLLDQSYFLIFSALIFAGLLICDYRRGLAPDYLQARAAVTVLVCSCLIIVAVSA